MMKTRRAIRFGLAMLIGLGIAVLLTGCDDDNCTNVHYTHAPPPVPAGVYSVTGDQSVQIYWSPIREAGILRYGIYRSLTPDGYYDWVADVAHSDDPNFDPYFIDWNLTNGVTYYYAVDTQSAGGESDLSYELVSDTPRPGGENLVLYADITDSTRAALDFSRIQDRGVASDMVRWWDDALADVYMIVVDDLFRLVPTVIEQGGEYYYNDIQDFGYTDSIDEISFAPLDGWSLDPYGVEMIPGHTYIVWTWDDHFAKIRVTTEGQASIDLDWAYQISEDDWERRQLKARLAESKGRGPKA